MIRQGISFVLQTSQVELGEAGPFGVAFGRRSRSPECLGYARSLRLLMTELGEKPWLIGILTICFFGL